MDTRLAEGLPTIPAAAVIRTAGPVRLRPPAAADLEFLHQIHSDPATYRHHPQGRLTSLDQTAAMLDQWLAHWSRHGFGYWLVEDAVTRRPLGSGGVVRRTPPDHDVPDGLVTDLGVPWLNLGYRLAASEHGRGLGRLLARECVAFAAEWLRALDLIALIRPANVASRRAAESAGLAAYGTVDDVAGAERSLRLIAPRVRVTDPAAVRDDAVALWQRVNRAGGAVGFRGDTPDAAVRAAYDVHAAQVADGSARLVTLTRPGTAAAPERLIGMGFWELGHAVTEHRGMVKRLMVEPDLTGRNLGRLLLEGMHGIGRELGLELSVLTVRGGTGTDAFYHRAGYVEVGRIPDGLRFAPLDGSAGWDYRDDLWLARRLDGAPR